MLHSRPRGLRTARAAAPLLFLLLLCPALLRAQASNAARGAAASEAHLAAAPRIEAVRADQEITVDGRLDEAVWQKAPAITEFRQIDPVEGAPVSQPTEVRIVYDESALYVGAVLRDSGPITTRLARRDAGLGRSDVFAVELDSYHDHQTAYRFSTTPSGMKRDGLVTGAGLDLSWDPIWDVATQVSDSAWVVEFRIPFSQLRFSPETEQVWGIQVERQIDRHQEMAVFAFVPKLEASGPQRFGHLTGLRGIRAGQRLELLPYVSARTEFVQGARESPFRGAAETFAGAGLDLKYRLSSNITLDASVNPDFGQVEVDPAVINLTAFETRFVEKRPFFIEGAEIFRFSEGGPGGSTGMAPEFFYSRRIGRVPHGDIPDEALYDESPLSATILGAAKLTGKVGDGWSVGLLEAVTGRETALVAYPGGAQEELAVEPLSNYLMARVRRDSNGGSTRVGAAFSAVNRDLADPETRDRLHSAAYTAGVDLTHEWAGRAWRFSTHASPSLVTGDPLALVRTQKASSRYYQRPDATHLGVDSAASSLAGYFLMAELNKQAGTFTGRFATAAVSPGYEVNDIGFQPYADRLVIDTHLQYNHLRPGRLLRSWSAGAAPDGVWNYAGERVLGNYNAVGRFQFVNYWSGNWRFEHIYWSDDDRLTRGGPMSRLPARTGGHLSLDSDPRRRNTVGGQVSYYTDDAGGSIRDASLRLGFKPRENWEITVGPNLSRTRSAAQYVKTVSDPRASATSGERYVFAPLDHTTLGIDTRVNVTFSPTLSFEMYAQPFISTGDYGTLRELREPGTFDFLEYGRDIGSLVRQDDGRYRVDPTGGDASRAFFVDDPDFTLRSLLGNAVLRWEWRPGSTLFLVWQQNRAAEITGLDVDPTLAGIGRLDWRHDASELFRIRPDNVFAIKINYWLNP